MNESQVLLWESDDDWRAIHEFWFPPGLDDASAETHRRLFGWWFGNVANAVMPPFAPVLEAARAGRIDHWRATPQGRLALIIVLYRFPRSLYSGTPAAYAADAEALHIALEGLRISHYDALPHPWEKTFFLLPVVHVEGPDHLARLDRAIVLAEATACAVAETIRPLYRFAVEQARGRRDVIARFGRFPHRNSILGRASTPEELAYLEKGDFVHLRRPPM